MEDYELPPNFSVRSYENAKAGLRSKQVRAALTGAAVVVAIVLVALCIRFGLEEGLQRSLFVGFLFLIFFHSVPDYLAKRWVKSDAWELGFTAEAEAYARAIVEWQFTQTEAGQSYWNALRGVAFEQAVANFFLRRGCDASLTDTTGDGGVDIVLKVGEQTYWCQCKGHAKPVPVAEIRRIAGATLKSKGVAKAVMLATNGFTKPALAEASQLGVICMDADRLCALASRSAISGL